MVRARLDLCELAGQGPDLGLHACAGPETLRKLGGLGAEGALGQAVGSMPAVSTDQLSSWGFAHV